MGIRRTIFSFALAAQLGGIAAIAGPALVSGAPVLPTGMDADFTALSPEERRTVQRHLAAPGLYDAAIDGAWGPGTRAALLAAMRSDGWPAYRGIAMAGGLKDEGQILLLYILSPAFAGQHDRLSSSGGASCPDCG